MARYRMIKPEFWSDGKICRLSRDVRLFFIGLWNFADDEGRLVNDPYEIKAHIFPLDSDVSPEQVSLWLHDLLTSSRLNEYSVNGQNYLQIVHFKEHQTINRPSPSKIPLPLSNSVSLHGVVSDDSFLSLSKVKLNKTKLSKDNTPHPPTTPLALSFDRVSKAYELCWGFVSSSVTEGLHTLFNDKPEAFTEDTWATWIVLAVQEAHKYKKMSVAYIKTVLENAIKKGNPPGTPRPKGRPPGRFGEDYTRLRGDIKVTHKIAKEEIPATNTPFTEEQKARLKELKGEK